LRNIAEENNLGHIKMRNVLIQGYLVKEVVKLSEKENIDFIVMGTKGITHLREVFLGTIATKIMNESNTTVLAIPEKCIYSPIEKILFNTRFHMDDIEPLKKVVALANVFHSHVDCLNVKPPHTVYTDDFVVDFKNVFKEQNIAFHSVLGNDIEGAILNFIDQNKIDMIAIHERHRGFFDKLFQISLSKKLTFNISIPILSVH
jgi:nucleotide-binding universal stress UspA family protein